MCWADYYGRAYGVPLEFVQAVIDLESAWHPYVVSAKGAVGIMQLTAPTAFTFGVTNRFLVEENIRGGVAYLAYLIRQFEGELQLGGVEPHFDPYIGAAHSRSNVATGNLIGLVVELNRMAID